MKCFTMAAQVHSPETAVLYGAMTSLKPLVEALNCISGQSRGQDVVVTHGSGGLRFSAARSTELASAILPPSAFTRLRCDDETLRIRVNLSALLDCLATLGTADALSAELWFAEARLHARVEGSDGTLEMGLAAFEDAGEEAAMHLDVGASPEVNAFIVDADALRDALHELDYGGATEVEVETGGELGRCRLLVPGGGRLAHPRVVAEVGQNANGFQCLRNLCMQSAIFRLPHVLRAVKALVAAESVKVVVNDAGLLSLLCRLRGGGNLDQRCFVEFVMVAEEIEDDGQDEEGRDEERRDEEDSDE